jgi:hypothetical protein
MISSRNNFLVLLACLLYCHDAFMQSVGIGTETPTQTLDVNGGIRIGSTAIANTGAMRWNETKSDFEGYNGITWVSLTGGKGKWGDQTSYSTENNATQIELLNSTVEGKEFGSALAAEGDWMVAGAYRDGVPNDYNKWAAGSIRIFQKINEQWQEKYLHRDPDLKTNDWFGESVGITSTHVIVGTPYADIGASVNIGKAYIYTYNHSTSNLQATLTASDGQPEDSFGSAVAIHGDIAVVGAPSNDVSGVSNMGSAYVFTRSGSTWTQSAILTPSDGQVDDYFGSYIALWGDYIAISTPYKMVNGFPYAGKTYVYRKNGSSWTLISHLASPNPYAFELYGFHVFIRDNVLLVGAPEHVGTTEPGNGSVYVYQLNNWVVSYQTTLTGSEGAKGDGFGVSAVYKDSLILVGAPTAAIGSSAYQGKAYIFRYANNSWTEEGILKSSVNEKGMRFGQSTALGTGTALIGAPFATVGEKLDNGQVFFFKNH